VSAHLNIQLPSPLRLNLSVGRSVGRSIDRMHILATFQPPNNMSYPWVAVVMYSKPPFELHSKQGFPSKLPQKAAALAPTPSQSALAVQKPRNKMTKKKHQKKSLSMKRCFVGGGVLPLLLCCMLHISHSIYQVVPARVSSSKNPLKTYDRTHRRRDPIHRSRRAAV